MPNDHALWGGQNRDKVSNCSRFPGMAQNPRIGRAVAGRMSVVGEEVLASILGALVSSANKERETLLAKAVVVLLVRGVQP
jgi:hypothetical protein